MTCSGAFHFILRVRRCAGRGGGEFDEKKYLRRKSVAKDPQHPDNLKNARASLLGSSACRKRLNRTLSGKKVLPNVNGSKNDLSEKNCTPPPPIGR